MTLSLQSPSSANPQAGTSSIGSGSSRSTRGSPTNSASSSPSASQRGSPKGSSGRSSSGSSKELTPLFYYMELGQWEKAVDRVKRHPREVKTWATIRTKSQTEISTSTGKPRVSGSKRLALHHACFKLRSAGSNQYWSDNVYSEDPFIQICKFILLLVRMYPEAAGQRETRHGCLPIHLAAFATCAPKEHSSSSSSTSSSRYTMSSPSVQGAIQTVGSNVTSFTDVNSISTHLGMHKPTLLNRRMPSDATSVTTDTHLSEIHADEDGCSAPMGNGENENLTSPSSKKGISTSVSMRSSIAISGKREEMAVQVINALLDAYPKGIRVDSEGGRLPLHTACAGRATPRVISTLVTAYPSAARHRNKDGFLPLHLSAHWGVSHPNVALTLLKCYPDATVGRNRWERTPLEEALCMAGENGRPHQAALVRALRKHPSYWTRPADILDHATKALKLRRNNGPTTVDIDESLPSYEDTTLEERDSYYGHEPDETLELEFNYSPSLYGRPVSTTRKVRDDPDIPLSKLIQHGQWEAVMCRLDANPIEAELELEVLTRGGFTAASGFTALHYACERQPPPAVVEALIIAHPVAVLTRTMPGGALPLHVACTWYASHAVIQALLSADQGACKVTDELGNVALHSACFSGAPVSIVESLLRTDGQSVKAQNHQGSRPTDVCKRLRHSNRKSVIAVLTLKKEEILAQHRRKGSFGSENLADASRLAQDLNDRIGPPLSGNLEDGVPEALHESPAIEVTYGAEVQQEGAQDDLMWI